MGKKASRKKLHVINILCLSLPLAGLPHIMLLLLGAKLSQQHQLWKR